MLSTNVGGFGGPLLGLTQLGDGAALLTGGRGGLVFDDRWLVGAALSATPTFEGALAPLSPSGERLALWSGGLLVEHVIAPESPVHARVGLVMGGAYVSVESEDRRTVRGGLAFSAEPNASLELNATRFLRVGFTVGYRLVLPAPVDVPAEALRGITGGMTFHFGGF